MIPPFLYIVNSYTGKMQSLYWDISQVAQMYKSIPYSWYGLFWLAIIFIIKRYVRAMRSVHCSVCLDWLTNVGTDTSGLFY